MGYCDYWNNSSLENISYHDKEWGVPLHDDKKLFEFLMLEVMQCGLSWDIVIRKRAIFKQCFADFDFTKIARFSDKEVMHIMATEGMIKSQRKIAAVIHNAQCFLKIRTEFGSFASYIWRYSQYKTIIYDKHNDLGYIPASNGLSDEISRDLKKRGFKFLGSVTVYSFLQAMGMINDHALDCPRYDYISKNFPHKHLKRRLEKNVCCFGAGEKVK